MAQYPCENCKLRAHYDKNPKSVLGRFWRWHINFCPGFKAYFTHQDAETQNALREKYDLHMTVERFVSEELGTDEQFIRK